MIHPWKKNNTMVEDPEFSTPVFEVSTEVENRCPYCKRLLFKGLLGPTTSIEIKCTRRQCEKIFTLVRI